MTRVEQITKQVEKVRAKINEFKSADEYVFSKLSEIDYNATYDEILAAEEAYLEAKKIQNRIGGEIKRMSRKAMQMYFDSECCWFNYEFTCDYIAKFTETFRYWN